MQTALPLQGLLIGLDPGHQARENAAPEPMAPGSNQTKMKVARGAHSVTNGTMEYVINLQVSLQLSAALQALGAQVAMTRYKHEVDISNRQRAEMMNLLDADLVLRIHCNADRDPAAAGIGLYVRQSGPATAESLAAAHALQGAMPAACGTPCYGVFQSDAYTGLNFSLVPCVIVEMGFMTNPAEDRLLQCSAYQQKLVQGMVQGIAAYFGRPLQGV